MTYNLPRLPAGTKLVLPDGSSTIEFATFWDQFARVIEKIVEDLTTVDADLTAAIADIAAAQAAADAAQDTADTVQNNTNISLGFTEPFDTLTGSDVGATATISIAAHDRRYGDGTSVSVNSGSIMGLNFATPYWIYYDDPTRAGGAVTYVAATNAEDATPQAATGRHFVGAIKTPIDGGANTTNGMAPPSGGGAFARNYL